MKNSIPLRRPNRPSEEGYTLLMVIFLMAAMLIAMSVAVPRVTKALQRDRETETMERGKQYMLAVRMYYHKFGAYPPSVDALVKTSNIRFLRKKYVDPTTGKEEWKPIQFGQNKAPTSMGFFGQPAVGSTLAGIGPSGGNSVASAAGDNTGAAGDASSTGGTGSSKGGGGSSTTGGTSSSVGSGLTGQTFGGAGIIGFSPNSPRQSILVYKKMNHYNEWEFTYDPLAERTVAGGNTVVLGQQGAPGAPPASTPTPAPQTGQTSTAQP